MTISGNSKVSIAMQNFEFRDGYGRLWSRDSTLTSCHLQSFQTALDHSPAVVELGPHFPDRKKAEAIVPVPILLVMLEISGQLISSSSSQGRSSVLLSILSHWCTSSSSAFLR